MKYIATISGGKDSTVMCDLLLKNGYPVDEIIFADTLMEFEDMYLYIDKLKEYFKARYGKSITVLKPDSDFKEWCFGTITRGEREGRVRGIPTVDGGVCYWRREAKVKPLDKYLKNTKIVKYIGFTLGEDRNVDDTDFVVHKYPLRDDFKMTEEDCKAYLINQEMENPLYRHFNRTGCFMCPFQSDKSFYETYKNYPKEWEYMKGIEQKLDGSVNDFWFTKYRTIEDMEKEFIKADRQGSLFDFSDEPLKDCFCKI